jgi:protein-S-isoprenylcysteine O-methyltransferase Ste14
MGSSSQATTIVETVVALLAIIVVFLRFLTRKITKAGLAADDWSILVGLLSYLAVGLLLLWGMRPLSPVLLELRDTDVCRSQIRS